MSIDVVLDKKVCMEYSSDYSLCKKIIPKGVFFPETTEEVSEILKKVNSENKSLTIWGAGSGVNGGCVPSDKNEFVLSLERMNKIEVIESDFIARVQAGANTQSFQKYCEKVGLFFPPDPSSSDISSIGGNLACSAGGMRGFKYGTFKDYILKIKIVDGLGNIREFGRETLKWVAGYDLVHLMVGSEGTLGIITEAVFKLLPKPQAKKTIYINFNSMEELVSSFLTCLKNGVIPSNAEFMDYNTLTVIKDYLPIRPMEGDCVLLVELDGSSEEIVDNLYWRLIENIKTDTYVVSSSAEKMERLWLGRKRLRIELQNMKANVFSEDFVLNYSKISDFIDFCQTISKENDVFVANFGHIIDGNIHTSFVFDNNKEKKKIESIIKRLSEYVIEKNGSIAGEHGIGKYKKDLLIKECGKENIELMKEIKRIFDPNNILNKGKIL
ncbi:MAG: glycolate oxidase subunit GlcD [Candidatus Muiribacterium halophilum]|uniref:Glycolate oxidase subunit GlcD n=1 Tax=Muiribacterium halophilum TaxID=2053465 RepID=A0A2N5ZA71_MUIH1|nr:MAG: glycolate oxidase subunit GlcD [Candidatus Muirbacterium halophilum]